MPNEVITTDQLKYYRLVSNNDQGSKDRWTRCYSWYPGRQHKEYGHVAQIYSESRLRYGDELFLRYASRNRLNHKHTGTAEAEKKEDLEEMPPNVNSGAKVPPTTNGEYGRFKPTRMHNC